ncbi:MAG: histidinol-phosphatase [Clostridia bacterium]|nr:histidinol-phosphatase [Clostridia bacterium]
MTDAGNRPLANYHTHTWRCLHAEGTEEEYVRRAIGAGFAVLGFSDHTPWPYESGYVSDMRMRLDQLQGYLDTVRALGERYADRIKIPVGLECEAFPRYMGWLSELKASSLDYVILGNHYDARDDADHDAFSDGGGFYFGRCGEPAHVRRYAERTIAGMRTGLFDYVAHPDLYCHLYPRFDAECAAAAEDICAAAKALDIPLEYNLLGVQYHAQEAGLGRLGYPCPRFWEIAARQGCKAIIGFDAHRPEALERRDGYDRALAFLTGLGLEVLPFLDKPGLR